MHTKYKIKRTKSGAGRRNRTDETSLEGWRFTSKLCPQKMHECIDIITKISYFQERHQKGNRKRLRYEV